MSKAVVCIAESEAQAEAILNELRSAGFSTNDISIIDVFDLLPDKIETQDKMRWRKNPRGRGLLQE